MNQRTCEGITLYWWKKGACFFHFLVIVWLVQLNLHVYRHVQINQIKHVMDCRQLYLKMD